MSEIDEKIKEEEELLKKTGKKLWKKFLDKMNYLADDVEKELGFISKKDKKKDKKP